MAHEIHQHKFLSYQVPAWHGLGMVLADPVDALAAANQLGLPEVSTSPIYTADGTEIEGYKVISGVEIDENTRERKETVYSVVSDEYQEITHRDFVKAWHRATKANVETMGLLFKGATLFISTKLPGFKVKGDECDNYLLAYNPLTGKDASTARITPVRVVCANTLAQSACNFRDQFRVIHTAEAAIDIERWLTMIWHNAEAQTQAIREAFEALASTRMNDEALQSVLERVYAEPAMPKRDPQTDEGLLTLAAWDRERQYMAVHREEVIALFHGQATGYSETFKGTAWGGWNAVVEYEDHLKPRRQLASVLSGNGADRKNSAFKEFLSMARA